MHDVPICEGHFFKLLYCVTVEQGLLRLLIHLLFKFLIIEQFFLSVFELLHYSVDAGMERLSVWVLSDPFLNKVQILSV